MKKLFTLLFSLLLLNVIIAQGPCTVTQTGAVPATGALIPTSLPDGTVGVLYNQIIEIGVPSTYSGMTISNVVLNSISGLPVGILGYCPLGTTPACPAMLPATWYCYTLYGTPSIAGTDSIDLSLTVTLAGIPYGVPINASAIFGRRIPLRINGASLPATPTTPSGEDTSCSNIPRSYTTTYTTGADTYIWTLSPSGAGSITGSTMTANVTWNSSFAGNASISVKAHNAIGDGASSGIFSVLVKNCTGINDLSAASVKLYPNPNSGEFTLTLKSHQTDNVNINVYDAIGSVVYSIKNLNTQNTNSEQISLPNIPSGMYYVEVKGNYINKVIRMMVQ